MDASYDIIIVILRYVYFSNAYNGQFCKHHQNCNHIKDFKDSKNVKIVRNYVLNDTIYTFFLI